MNTETEPTGDFARHAEKKSSSLAGEAFAWLRHNKKWWLVPVVVALLLAAALIVLSGTAVAPLIYTLF